MEGNYLGLGTIGQIDSELSPESMAKINEIMQICDNLFFTNYYETGGQLKTREEIVGYLKQRTAAALIDYYGEAYADNINEAINGVKYEFVYQTVGDRSSMSKFLEKKRMEYFQKKTGFNSAQYKSMFAIISKIEKTYRQNINAILNDKAKFLNDLYFMVCLQMTGMDTSILDDPAKFQAFYQKLLQFQEITCTYSDNPEVNSNMKKVEQYVSDYYKDAMELYGNQIAQYRQGLYKYVSKVCYDKDLFRHQSSQSGQFIFQDAVGAYYNIDNDTIYLSNSANDETLIHENIHLITVMGFLRSQNLKSKFDNNFPVLSSNLHNLFNKDKLYLRENEIIDETLVTFCAQDIVANMNGDTIVGTPNQQTVAYSQLASIVAPLYQSYLSAFKDAHLSLDPIATLSGTLGSRNVQRLSSLLNEIFSMTGGLLQEPQPKVQQLINKLTSLVDELSSRSISETTNTSTNSPTSYGHM